MRRCEQLKEKKADIVKYFFNLHHMSVYIVHLQHLCDGIVEFWEDEEKLR